MQREESPCERQDWQIHETRGTRGRCLHESETGVIQEYMTSEWKQMTSYKEVLIRTREK